jgi:hypothetical protein
MSPVRLCAVVLCVVMMPVGCLQLLLPVCDGADPDVNGSSCGHRALCITLACERATMVNSLTGQIWQGGAGCLVSLFLLTQRSLSVAVVGDHDARLACTAACLRLAARILRKTRTPLGLQLLHSMQSLAPVTIAVTSASRRNCYVWTRIYYSPTYVYAHLSFVSIASGIQHTVDCLGSRSL